MASSSKVRDARLAHFSSFTTPRPRITVTHGALLMHTSNPLLKSYRFFDGSHTYWGHPKAVLAAYTSTQEEAYAQA